MTGGLDLELHPKQGLALLTEATELGYGGAAGGGKALSLDTSILTKAGWSAMGALKVGDVVYDENGRECTVINTSEVFHHHDCYRLTFDDGYSIVADAGHRWLSYSAAEREALHKRTEEYRQKRRETREKRGRGKRPDLAIRNSLNRVAPTAAPVGTVRTTLEMFEASNPRSFTIPLCKPIDYPAKELPIHPYVLGAWLGDGTSQGCGFTCNDQGIIEKIRSCGYEVKKRSSPYGYGILKLTTVLRDSNLKENKHIPELYLAGSVEQRFELLRGLMDTDGSCDKDGGAEFSNTNEKLALDVVKLMRSLGLKPHLNKKRARVNGKDCGICYRVKVTTTAPIFHLARKAERLPKSIRVRIPYRAIVSIKKIKSVPTKCISVSSPSNLFLAGEALIPTHNSHLGRASAIYFSYLIPGLQTYLFRRTSNELTKNHMMGPTSFPAMLGVWVRGGFVRIVKNEIRFGNGTGPNPFESGSRIFLCHCQHEKDVFNWLGPEMHYLIIEQAEQFTPFMIKMLRGRNRIPEALNIPEEYKKLFPRTLYTFNPGGVGHAFFKSSFVKGLPRGENGVSKIVEQPDEEGGKLRQFIQAKLDDNPSVNPKEYRKTLRGLPPRMAKALEEGDFDQVIGAFFPEIDRRLHLIKPISIPLHWARLQAMDWGACGEGDPFVCGWWTTASESIKAINSMGEQIEIPRNSLICYRRWNGKGLPKVTATMVAQGIRSREQNEKILMRVAGGDITNKAGHGPSIFEIFGAEGVHFTKADRRRPEGHAQFRERLVGVGGIPRIYWFQEYEDDLETIMNLQHDLHDPNECTEGDDHNYESDRYMCMARPWSTTKKVETEPWQNYKDPTIDQLWKQRETLIKNQSRW